MKSRRQTLKSWKCKFKVLMCLWESASFLYVSVEANIHNLAGCEKLSVEYMIITRIILSYLPFRQIIWVIWYRGRLKGRVRWLNASHWTSSVTWYKTYNYLTTYSICVIRVLPLKVKPLDWKRRTRRRWQLLYFLRTKLLYNFLPNFSTISITFIIKFKICIWLYDQPVEKITQWQAKADMLTYILYPSAAGWHLTWFWHSPESLPLASCVSSCGSIH